jgi:signal transduction histidine kinase
MRLPALKIQHKIVLPFTLLFVAAMLITAGVSVSLISHVLELRVRQQIDHVSETLAQAGFALNPSILEKLKWMVGAEVLTYRPNGEVLASTWKEPIPAALLAALQTPDVAHRLFHQDESVVIREVRWDGAPFRVAYRRLQAPEEGIVALAVPAADIVAARGSIARTLGVVAVLMIALMGLVGHRIARSITAPLQRLVEAAGEVAAGDRSRKITVDSRDEVGTLAAAFDEMVQRLRTSEEDLLHSEKLALTGQLAARVAHDVRNPLSSIKMRAQLLRTKLKPGAENVEVLEGILQEIGRVEWVIAGLLDLSRPAELLLLPRDANDVLRDVLRSMEAQLKHRKIVLRTELQPGLPAVMIDANGLTMALVNLITNAADAMPDGGTLTTRTRATDDDRSIVLEIADDGIGIDPSVRERLFDPFFSTKREGVGLGLVNSKSIVERHGGRLELVAGDGGGTRVVVSLPVAGAAPPAESMVRRAAGGGPRRT